MGESSNNYFSPSCKNCNSVYNHSRNKPFSLFPCQHTFCYVCLIKLDAKFCFGCRSQINEINPNLGILDCLKKTEYDIIYDDVKKVLIENGDLNKVVFNTYENSINTNKESVLLVKNEIEIKTNDLIEMLKMHSKKFLTKINNSEINYLEKTEQIMNYRTSIEEEINQSLEKLNKEDHLGLKDFHNLKLNFESTKLKLNQLFTQIEEASHKLEMQLSSSIQAFEKVEEKIKNAFKTKIYDSYQAKNDSSCRLKSNEEFFSDDDCVPLNLSRDCSLSTNNKFDSIQNHEEFSNNESNSSNSTKQIIQTKKYIKISDYEMDAEDQANSSDKVNNENNSTNFHSEIDWKPNIDNQEKINETEKLIYKEINLLDIKGNTLNGYGWNLVNFLWDINTLKKYRIVDPFETNIQVLRKHPRYKPIMNEKEDFEKLELLKKAILIKYRISQTDWINKWRKLCQYISKRCCV